MCENMLFMSLKDIFYVSFNGFHIYGKWIVVFYIFQVPYNILLEAKEFFWGDIKKIKWNFLG